MIIILCINSFSGCILNEIFGTNFSLNSWRIYDDDGFPGIYVDFYCSGAITIKTFNPNRVELDSELFLHGNSNTTLHLGAYRETIAAGDYKLRVFDKNDNEIFEQTITVNNPKLNIFSCEQHWWYYDNDYSLIGLTMNVYNNGEIPVYPSNYLVSIDSEIFTGYVLPCFISPGQNDFVDFFIYSNGTPINDDFTVNIQDSSGNDLISDKFLIELENNVEDHRYNWNYNGKNRELRIPKPEFMLDYFIGLERVLYEDFSCYVFDVYDDHFLDFVINMLKDDFESKSIADEVNFIASFVQNLEYLKDSPTNESVEYPRYPIETLFNQDGGGDCEDKAILTASLLEKSGFEVALFRLPDHMAVGVQLGEDDSSNEYYVDNYYFLETTTVNKPVGFIPSEHKNPSNLSVYPITKRPLIFHEWKDNVLSILRNTELGDFVKIHVIVKNFGSKSADEVDVKAAFYTINNVGLNIVTNTITSLDPGNKQEITLIVNIPSSISTSFITRTLFDGEITDEHTAVSDFP